MLRTMKRLIALSYYIPVIMWKDGQTTMHRPYKWCWKTQNEDNFAVKLCILPSTHACNDPFFNLFWIYLGNAAGAVGASNEVVVSTSLQCASSIPSFLGHLWWACPWRPKWKGWEGRTDRPKRKKFAHGALRILGPASARSKLRPLRMAGAQRDISTASSGHVGLVVVSVQIH